MLSIRVPVLVLLLTLCWVGIAVGAPLRNADFLTGFPAEFEQAKGKGLAAIDALARKCVVSGLFKQARECAAEALKLKADDPTANEISGRVLVDKAWLTPAERDAKYAQANPGKLLWGAKYVTSAEMEELRKKERAKIGWECDSYFSDQSGFVLHFKGPYDDAMSVRRLVEATVRGWSSEFGTSVGMPRDALSVHVFDKQQEMSSFVARVTGQAASSPNVFDPKTLSSFVVFNQDNEMFSRDMVVEAVIRGILGMLGENGDRTSLWFHYAFLYYFRIARDGPESIAHGFIRKYAPDLRTIAVETVAGDNMFDLKGLLSGGSAYFSDDPKSSRRAVSYAVFYIVNFEFQGLYKADFHAFLKAAFRGKCDYKAFSQAVKGLSVLEKELPALVAGLSFSD
ncbi:MAG: hypothetical protein WC712_01370 [Candidatus Brocadiia bacterium]